MLNINFKGIIPQQKEYQISVQGNNETDRIILAVEKIQNDIDLTQLVPFLKVESIGKEYVDKIGAKLTKRVDDEYIYLTWIMTSKSTQYRKLNLQLQFEQLLGDGSSVKIWQSAICTIELQNTIKADEVIPEREPEKIIEIEDTLVNHEQRITALEENPPITEVKWGEIEGDIHEQEDLMQMFGDIQDEIDDLDNDLNDEKTAREQADSVLSQAIADEEERAKGVEADLQEQIDNKKVEWGAIEGNIEDQEDLQESLQEIREVAEGKTKTFVIDTDTEGNEVFKSDDTDIIATSFTDIDGNVVLTNTLKKGDAIFTKNTATVVYKDRWLIDPVNGKWSILSADNPDMTNYYTKTEANALFALQSALNNYYLKTETYSNEEIDQILEDYYNADEIDGLLADYAKLDGNNAFSGTNTFNNDVDIKGTTSNTHYLNFYRGNVRKRIGIDTNNYFFIEDYQTGIRVKFTRNGTIIVPENLSDGTNSSSVADIINGTFNVINASDIGSDGSLTDEQIAIIKNGKPTKIIGTVLSRLNPTIHYVNPNQTNPFLLVINGYVDFIYVERWRISQNKKLVRTNLTNIFSLDGIKSINGKDIPAYSKGALYYDGTNLSWNDNVVQSSSISNVVKLTQEEYDDLETKDSSTLYIIVG